jgi:predicted permease
MLPIISQSWRSWKRAKGVALLAIVALAVGIGCATAIFTVLNGVMLRPLPYSYPERWVALFGGSTLSSETDRYSGLSISDLTDYQQRTHSFDVLGWYNISGTFNLTSSELVEHVQGAEVTASLLDNTGVNAIVGRLFQDSDGPHVAVISTSLWKRLGADPAIVGKSITLNGQLYAVTGVMPAWFQLPIVGVSNENLHSDVWVPVNPPTDEGARQGNAIYAGYARLKPGITLAQASADAKRVAAQILKENPSHNPSYTARLFSLRDFVIKDIRPYLLLSLAAAALLLIVTCANVAGLLVAKSVSQAQEIAVRVALGARYRHLATQFFFEGCLISIAAAGLGLLLSVGLTRVVLSLAAEYIPRSNEISTDRAVLLFAAGLACLTALLPALAPLWQAMRTQPNEVLSEGVRASAGSRSRRVARSLVVAEIAFAFLLLASSGLLISELENLLHTPPGFEANDLLTFQLDASREEYPSPKQLLDYQERLLSSLQALPGVRAAAFANQLPLNCCYETTLYPEGQSPNPDLDHSVSFHVISPSYFNTMRIPLQKGRLLNENDTNENPAPVLIDEAAARRFWPTRDPVGAFGRFGDASGPRLQVVGLVGSVRNDGLGEATRPELYLLNALTPQSQMYFVLRSDLPAATLVPAVRTAVQRLDPTRTIYDVHTMDEIVANSVMLQRFDSLVVAVFALAALLLAWLGIYGVTSYSVRERRVEIGTRMALGASPGNLLKLVLGDSLKMGVHGILIGVPAAAAPTWLITRFLHLHHIGALPYAGSGGIVGGLAIAASVFPAWRATLVSPMVAIRNESESLWTSARRSFAQSGLHRSSQAPSSGSAPALVTGLSSASRRADSFSQALRIALSDLREGMRSQSAMLFESAGAPDAQYRCRAASPKGLVEGSIPAGGFLLGRLRSRTSPLAFTSEEMDTVRRWASDHKPQYVPEIEFLKKAEMRLAVPLRTKEETTGFLLLGPSLDTSGYSATDKDVLQIYAQQLALMIENAQLTDRVLEQEKIRRDLALAAEVQERLLPQKSIESGSIAVAAFTLPARGIGGDCYDFLDLGDHGIGIALADVAGKGIAAALIMSATQTSLRIIASEGLASPLELAKKMNSFLYRSTGADNYATFFYAEVNSAKQELRYVNAGHNPPYLLRACNSPPHVTSQATIEELDTGGTVIGMFPDPEYEEAVVELCPGDVLLAFTDGVTEALNPGQVEFGASRLRSLLYRTAHLPVKEIVSCISDELRGWIAGAAQRDDLTLIVMKMN